MRTKEELFKEALGLKTDADRLAWLAGLNETEQAMFLEIAGNFTSTLCDVYENQLKPVILGMWIIIRDFVHAIWPVDDGNSNHPIE